MAIIWTGTCPRLTANYGGAHMRRHIIDHVLDVERAPYVSYVGMDSTDRATAEMLGILGSEKIAANPLVEPAISLSDIRAPGPAYVPEPVRSGNLGEVLHLPDGSRHFRGGGGAAPPPRPPQG
jgi:hypothetical protein